MDVAAILPCRGRAEQTIANVRRLLETASYAHWRLWCVVDHDPAVHDALSQIGDPRLLLMLTDTQHGYWRALHMATVNTDAPLLCNLANDLHAKPLWLANGIAAYQARFGDGDGLMGFSGDAHGIGHSCHFLISRALLARYGGWPVWYRHNFGDTELCQRAQAERRYGKATHAVLEHHHHERGLATDDAVYQEGRATYDTDARLFAERRRAGWPAYSGST